MRDLNMKAPHPHIARIRVQGTAMPPGDAAKGDPA